VGQRLHPHQCVGWLVIPEERDPALFDRWQVLSPVLNNEDRDLGHLLGPGTAGGERTTDVVERLAGLDR